MQPGQIIWLNGTSSVGKSTIAKKLQEILSQPYLHTGIDHFLAAVPWSRLFVYSDSTTQTAAEGWFLPFRNGTLIGAPCLGPVAYQWLSINRGAMIWNSIRRNLAPLRLSSRFGALCSSHTRSRHWGVCVINN